MGLPSGDAGVPGGSNGGTSASWGPPGTGVGNAESALEQDGPVLSQAEALGEEHSGNDWHRVWGSLLGACPSRPATLVPGRPGAVRACRRGGKRIVIGHEAPRCV